MDLIHLKSQVNDHLKSQKHLKSSSVKLMQTTIDEFSSDSDANVSIQQYTACLSKCFIEAEIPLFKLCHPHIKTLFNKEHNRELPTHQTIYSNVDKILKNCEI